MTQELSKDAHIQSLGRFKSWEQGGMNLDKHTFIQNTSHLSLAAQNPWGTCSQKPCSGSPKG